MNQKTHLWQVAQNLDATLPTQFADALFNGSVVLSVEEARRICDRLEYDQSWDKTGSAYYSVKDQLDAIMKENEYETGV